MSITLTMPDCGDNSCCGKLTGGMRTNGGCRCYGVGRLLAEDWTLEERLRVRAIRSQLARWIRDARSKR